MVDAVAVGERHHRTRRDGEDVWNECLVELVHHRSPRLARLEGAAGRRFQIHDRLTAVRAIALGRRAQLGDRRPPLGGRRSAAQRDEPPDAAVAGAARVGW